MSEDPQTAVPLEQPKTAAIETADAAGTSAAPVDAAGKAIPAPPSQPHTYKYELPANVTLSDEQKGLFHAAIDTALTDPNASAKKLIDLFAGASEALGRDVVREVFAEENNRQHAAFNDVRKAWRTEAMADPEIGGAGHQTAMAEVVRVRARAVPQKDDAAFDRFLQETGAGDHPAYLRMMRNLARYIRVPQAEEEPPPQAAPTPPPRVLYDHPRSRRPR